MISLACSSSSLEAFPDRCHSMWGVFTDYLLLLVVIAHSAGYGVRESRAIVCGCDMTFQWTTVGPLSPRCLLVWPMSSWQQCTGTGRICLEEGLLLVRLRAAGSLGGGRDLLVRSC